jgi:hypothetical protein
VPRLPFIRSCTVHPALPAIAGVFLTIAGSSSEAFASTGCPGDVSANHLTNVNDLLTVIDNWGACPGLCAADVAPPGGNDVVDVNDLLTVINGWGACPCTPSLNCLSAASLWCEDWELVNYSRWTGGYGEPTSCEQNGFSTAESVTPTHSQWSAVVCASAQSHRGYGGLRFQGDVVLPSFTIPSSGGISAPNGVIVTFWSWYSVPYTFSPTKWMSLMTVTPDCSNTWADVITLNLDDSTMRIKPVHVSSVTYAPGAPSMPEEQWVRTTVYINFNSDVLHVWQNGQKVCNATFSNASTTMCQWHFGLYASGNNDDIELYEENLSIVKLLQPLTNFTDEPWYATVSACNALP